MDSICCAIIFLICWNPEQSDDRCHNKRCFVEPRKNIYLSNPGNPSNYLMPPKNVPNQWNSESFWFALTDSSQCERLFIFFFFVGMRINRKYAKILLTETFIARERGREMSRVHLLFFQTFTCYLTTNGRRLEAMPRFKKKSQGKNHPERQVSASTALPATESLAFLYFVRALSVLRPPNAPSSVSVKRKHASCSLFSSTSIIKPGSRDAHKQGLYIPEPNTTTFVRTLHPWHSQELQLRVITHQTMLMTTPMVGGKVFFIFPPLWMGPLSGRIVATQTMSPKGIVRWDVVIVA